jgi:hypothetical protein
LSLSKGIVFRYEIKRLLFSKEYLLLLIVTLAYGVSLLSTMVLYGVNYTAPFSPLTFSTYCTSLAPFLFILLLVLCARQSTVSERGAEAIISAMPIPLYIFRLLRYSAVACAFLIATALPLTACFVFYRLVFNYTTSGALLWFGLLLLLPPAILLFGAAMLFVNRRAVVYILLTTVLIVCIFQIKLPVFIDLIGSTAVQPFTAGEHDFAFSSHFITGRIAFSVVGIVLIIVSL